MVGIRSFSNRSTTRFARGDRRRLPAELAYKIDCLLKLLDRGTSPEDLRAERVRVHRLAGDRRGERGFRKLAHRLPIPGWQRS